MLAECRHQLDSPYTLLLVVCAQEDTYSWRSFIETAPNTWINGYDKGMQLITESMYDLRVLPVFYLLNSRKEILLKDVPFSKIEGYLQQ